MFYAVNLDQNNMVIWSFKKFEKSLKIFFALSSGSKGDTYETLSYSFFERGAFENQISSYGLLNKNQINK